MNPLLVILGIVLGAGTMLALIGISERISRRRTRQVRDVLKENLLRS